MTVEELNSQNSPKSRAVLVLSGQVNKIPLLLLYKLIWVLKPKPALLVDFGCYVQQTPPIY
ncbi:hypothetical protein [Streptococcus mutans]|uniref:hypothetical protein n=1 Tax=Streptococcus mutans TaxID=1309 RepID=UPI0002B5B933|nr:hypothetical protein [Streptococcus mutans]EMC45226.1 hypothetical protein SMU99_05402 [Streptococcus mutans 24]NLQ42753.1 hypothetical protein [Streptococcus mutans]